MNFWHRGVHSGSWFHHTCHGLLERELGGWFCDDVCRVVLLDRGAMQFRNNGCKNFCDYVTKLLLFIVRGAWMPYPSFTTYP